MSIHSVLVKDISDVLLLHSNSFKESEMSHQDKTHLSDICQLLKEEKSPINLYLSLCRYVKNNMRLEFIDFVPFFPKMSLKRRLSILLLDRAYSLSFIKTEYIKDLEATLSNVVSEDVMELSRRCEMLEHLCEEANNTARLYRDENSTLLELLNSGDFPQLKALPVFALNERLLKENKTLHEDLLRIQDERNALIERLKEERRVKLSDHRNGVFEEFREDGELPMRVVSKK